MPNKLSYIDFNDMLNIPVCDETARTTAGTNAANIGSLNALKTTDKTNLVNAINELYTNDLSVFANKSVCIVGDSISSVTTYPPNWTVPFTELVESVGGNVTNVSVDGASLVGFADEVNRIPTGKDVYIIFLGVNDYQGQFEQSRIISSVQTIMQHIDLSNPDRLCFYVSALKTYRPEMAGYYTSQGAYRLLFETLMRKYGARIISGDGAPNLNLYTYGTYLNSDDKIHPMPIYRYILCDYIVKGITSGINQHCEPHSFVIANEINQNLSYTTGNIITNWIDGNTYQVNFNLFGVSLTAGVWTSICKIGNSVGLGHGLIDNFDTDTLLKYDGSLFQIRINDAEIQVVPPSTGTFDLTFSVIGHVSIDPSLA